MVYYVCYAIPPRLIPEPHSESLPTDVNFSRILVPIKSLPEDEDVLDLALSHAAVPHGYRRPRQTVKVEVIHVVEVPQSLPLDADLPEAVQQGDVVLAYAEAAAKRQDTLIQAELLQARSAGVAIVDEAIERGADLIIIGAHYRRRHGEFSLGETLPYVFKNAPCRVWVARAPRTESALR